MVGTHYLQNVKGEVAKLPEVVGQYKELISDTVAIAEEVIISSVCQLYKSRWCKRISEAIYYKLKNDVWRKCCNIH